jgi:hypothetical protein
MLKGGPGRLLSVRKDAGGAGSATFLDSPKLGIVSGGCLDPPSAGGEVSYEPALLQAEGVAPNTGLVSTLTMPNHVTVEVWTPDGSASALLEIASFVAGGKCIWQATGIVRGP